MLRAPSIRRIVVLALATAMGLCASGLPIAAATPNLAQEEQRGESIVESVRAGETRCADLSADEFELIGEYAMGRYLGSEATHSAMNRRMTAMMGEAGERRMHIALGYRYSGCSGGPASGWVGPMAGMMGARGSGGNGPGMMGGGEYGERGYHWGGMMGSAEGGSGISALGAVMLALAAAAVGAAVAALSMQRRRPDGDAAP